MPSQVSRFETLLPFGCSALLPIVRLDVAPAAVAFFGSQLCDSETERVEKVEGELGAPILSLKDMVPGKSPMQSAGYGPTRHPHARALRAQTVLRPMRGTVEVQPTSTAEMSIPTPLDGKYRFFTFNTSTNGFDTERHRILELALVDVETGEGFHRIINPRSPPKWLNHKDASKIHAGSVMKLQMKSAGQGSGVAKGWPQLRQVQATSYD